jgi:hypothetical protein
MKRTYFCLSLLMMSFVSVAQADLTATNSTAVPATQTPLAPLISFVLKTEEPNNAETYIVQNLNLGHQDIPVIQKGWKSSSDKMSHLVAVSTNNQDDVLIFVFNENVDGVCWLTSKSGEVRSTVAFSRSSHTSRVIANEVDLNAFEREKKYLLGKVYAAEHKRQ